MPCIVVLAQWTRYTDDPSHLYRYDEAGNPLPTQTASQGGAAFDTLDAEDPHELRALNAHARTYTGEWTTVGQLPARVEHSKAGIYLLLEAYNLC